MAKPAIYTAPADYVGQGDIFKCHVLGTYGGTTLNILRSVDGARPEQQFTTAATLKFVKAFEVHQHPICEEIVSCQVEHLSYFVVASQTCDIAGADHAAGTTCFIAKMTSFCDFVNHSCLPAEWRDENGNVTVRNILLADFLDVNISSAEGKALKPLRDDHLNYPGALRAALRTWKPENNSNEQRLKTKLQNFLTDIAENKKGRTYYFPPESTCSIPEAFVDLSILFPVTVRDVHNAKAQRLATIANPYKEEFSQRIGERFSRVAVPVPVKGERF